MFIIKIQKLIFTTCHNEQISNSIVQILEATGSVEKHDSIFIIMSQKNSKQSQSIQHNQQGIAKSKEEIKYKN